jgi:TolA-binding protein
MTLFSQTKFRASLSGILIFGLAFMLVAALDGVLCSADQTPQQSQAHTITSATSESDVAKTLSRDESEYKDIFDLYSRGDYETALKKLTFFERYFPKSKLQSSAEN